MKKREDIITLLVLLFLLTSCSSISHEKQQEIDANIEKLKAIETLDIAQVDNAVADMQKELAQDRENLVDGEINYREIFANVVVMGDSIAAGLEEYNLLNAMQVVAARGKNLDTIEDEIEKVIQLAPSHIFFSYGMNDLAYCNGKTDVFISRYEGVIQKIRDGLPNVKLHINAILPIQQHAIDEEPVYANYTDFNKALKDMCKRLNVDFLDNSSIISKHEIIYAADGVHPAFDFYPYWLEHMAERL